MSLETLKQQAEQNLVNRNRVMLLQETIRVAKQEKSKSEARASHIKDPIARQKAINAATISFMEATKGAKVEIESITGEPVDYAELMDKNWTIFGDKAAESASKVAGLVGKVTRPGVKAVLGFGKSLYQNATR